ncbi:family 16 glycosylhydrolase [Nesterenkonia sp. CF4.4]|uniref:family 16 glycosylhydrolase n=1 Tax=Nesterenkonia sp. CF4.4 TaxID=3373079 RepID=UPI003EE6D4FC
MRVSNLQTGTYSGPVGSSRGTHRHREDGLLVRTATPQRLYFAPAAGRIDVTVAAGRDQGCMLAAWLIGTEHGSPQDSGEICLFEIDAETVGETSRARSGVKAHHDSGLTTDMAEVLLPFDASRPHTWSVLWGNGETLIGCEGAVLRKIAQAPNYPLFLMIDLFEIGTAAGEYPKTAVVQRVRGWSW